MGGYKLKARTPLLERFERVENGCWEWLSGRNSWGYGVTYVNARAYPAHRVVYETLVGPIPHGLDLDHLCRNRGCVNPDHLEPVTRRENVRRGASGVLKTACRNGHDFPENVLRDARGWRICPACVEAKRLRRNALHLARVAQRKAAA